MTALMNTDGLCGGCVVKPKWDCRHKHSATRARPLWETQAVFYFIIISHTLFTSSIICSPCVHTQPTRQPCSLTLMCKIAERGPWCFQAHVCSESMWTSFLSGGNVWDEQERKKSQREGVTEIRRKKLRKRGDESVSEQRGRESFPTMADNWKTSRGDM